MAFSVRIENAIQLRVQFGVNKQRIRRLQEAVKVHAREFVNECMEEAALTMQGYDRARKLGIVSLFSEFVVREEGPFIVGQAGDTEALTGAYGKTNLRFGFWYNMEFGRNPHEVEGEHVEPIQENPDSLDIWELPLETLLQTLEEPFAGQESWGKSGLHGGMRPGRFIRGARLEALRKATDLAPDILRRAIADVEAAERK